MKVTATITHNSIVIKSGGGVKLMLLAESRAAMSAIYDVSEQILKNKKVIKQVGNEYCLAEFYNEDIGKYNKMYGDFLALRTREEKRK